MRNCTVKIPFNKGIFHKGFSKHTSYYLEENKKMFTAPGTILEKVKDNMEPAKIMCNNGNIPHQDTEDVLSKQT